MADKKMTLENIWIMKLQALYDMEKQLVDGLKEMSEAATDNLLKTGFEKHLEQTKNQVARLEQIFTMLKIEPKALEGEAIRGMIEDAEWAVDNVEGSAALDAVLVGAAQHVEHYEMAGYRTTIEWARLLGNEDAAKILEETYKEEEATSMELMQMAQQTIDARALNIVEA